MIFTDFLFRVLIAAIDNTILKKLKNNYRFYPEKETREKRAMFTFETFVRVLEKKNQLYVQRGRLKPYR